MTKLMPPTRPEDIDALSDRKLIEAIYRGIYGEEPIHPGLARRVNRLEKWIALIAFAIVALSVEQFGPEIVKLLG